MLTSRCKHILNISLREGLNIDLLFVSNIGRNKAGNGDGGKPEK